MNDKRLSLGQEWLKNYSEGLVNENTELIASLFHSGLTYIVNDSKREGSETFCKQGTWKYIFSKVTFKRVEAYNIFEPHEGHLFYHEALEVYIKSENRSIEGHFGDESVLNRDGKMMLINRVASVRYFEEFINALS
jgi:hypothetical protein